MTGQVVGFQQAPSVSRTLVTQQPTSENLASPTQVPTSTTSGGHQQDFRIRDNPETVEIMAGLEQDEPHSGAIDHSVRPTSHLPDSHRHAQNTPQINWNNSLCQTGTLYYDSISFNRDFPQLSQMNVDSYGRDEHAATALNSADPNLSGGNPSALANYTYSYAYDFNEPITTAGWNNWCNDFYTDFYSSHSREQ